jgi:hypothetical protein
MLGVYTIVESSDYSLGSLRFNAVAQLSQIVSEAPRER